MHFEWDSRKDTANRRRHRISFDLAREVWDDPLHVTTFDRIDANGEWRWHTFGEIDGILILVVHTYPDPDDEAQIRIISARKATPHERRRYEEEIL